MDYSQLSLIMVLLKHLDFLKKIITIMNYRHSNIRKNLSL